ncbi:RING finger protein 207-like [Elysia marginata]|uniref:RING finger protein 207-like n=1 Tax=Elysia marginata TaxID=1093978 RepID=A0AAV4EW60_9GAST|nr:RING finger protein 207-like [Elysia marginata]
MASLLDEINAVQPDSQLRVDAIRGAEEERLTQIANRTNPLDDELIKTKGLLRCPSLRSMKGERRKSKQDKDIHSASEKESSVAKVDHNVSSNSSKSLSTRDVVNLSSELSASRSSSYHLAGKGTQDTLLAASASALPCSQEKTAKVKTDHRETVNCDNLNSKLSNVLWPSPSISCPQYSAAVASATIDASYTLRPSGETSFISNPALRGNDSHASVNLEEIPAAPSRHNEKFSVSNACDSGADRNTGSIEGQESAVGSYVSLASYADFNTKYVNKSDTNAAVVCNGIHGEKLSTVSQELKHTLKCTENEGLKKSFSSRFKKDEEEKDVAFVCDARKELLKDVENFNKKENLTSAGKLQSTTKDSV